MRASGAGAQPLQTVGLPTDTSAASATATSSRREVSTPVELLNPGLDVKRRLEPRMQSMLGPEEVFPGAASRLGDNLPHILVRRRGKGGGQSVVHRWRTALLIVILVGALNPLVEPLLGQWGSRALPPDGRLTFVRVRWKRGTNGDGRPAGPNNFWLHEFPSAEQNLMTVLGALTKIEANTESSLVLTLDDPQFFHYPIAMIWEPGYWVMTDVEATRLGEYLKKGGFLIVNDFEREQWSNFEGQMRRAWPGARWLPMDRRHPIFNAFFRIEHPEVPHAAFHHLAGLTPKYFGLFEDNDPSGRLLAIANYDTNLAEYWQHASAGFFPVEASNNAFKLGVNYMIYGLTH
jgi:hypothetical protein